MVDIVLQGAVQAVLDELVADGDEVGLQAAVIKDGARRGGTRNRFSPDFTAIARPDDVVAEAYPAPANPKERNL